MTGDLLRQRMREAIIRRAMERGRPLTEREKLRNLWDALVEHDSDCAARSSRPCNCGAVEFKRKFLRP